MIIVTGGTSGIGAEITKNLISEGQEVITISRRGLEGKNHIQCDITDYESIKFKKHVSDRWSWIYWK